MSETQNPVANPKEPNSPSQVTRRSLLKCGVLSTGGLWLGTMSACSSQSEETSSPSNADGNLQPFGRLELHSDGKVALQIDKIEMGQGVTTGLPTLIGEELNTHPEQIRIIKPEFTSPASNPKYSPTWGTGGSSSMSSNWGELRQAAATLREWLKSAAAKEKGGSPSDYVVENGQVRTTNNSGSIDWKDLIKAAATLPLPSAELKKPPFLYIGKEFPRLHSVERVTGQAEFGIDSGPEDSLIAVVERSPYMNGMLDNADKSAAKKSPGVVDVIDIPTGIAVIATSYWQATEGRKALKAKWAADSDLKVSSQEMLKRLKDIPASDGKTARWEGSGWEQRPQDDKDQLIDVEYSVPFLAHAPMEPQNCTAWFHDGICDVWAPTQRPTEGRRYAAEAAGLPSDKINFYSTLLGGGFGRRLENDYVVEAVHLAKAANEKGHKKAIKVIWSREDDMRNSGYRPMTFNRFKASINQDGQPIAWQHQILLPGGKEESDRQRGTFSKLKEAILGKDPVINGATEGAADMPYQIPNIDVFYQRASMPTKRSAWRSIGHSQNGFLVESFIDEMAATAKKDPFQFRLSLLGDKPKHQAVLKLVAEKAKWKANSRQGIAVHESYGSTVAHVVELHPVEEGQPVKIKKVTSAVHCGFAVTPSIIKDQVMSAVIFGLSAALYGQITYDDQGGVEQTNFHDYPIMRMSEVPEIEVHIVESADYPSGIGEPGLPPIAPALTNAIFAATGKRIRSLPVYPV